MEFEFLIPIFVMMIPIVAILTSHQRKMAELMHDKHRDAQQANTSGLQEEVTRLRYEIDAMRQTVQQQTIELDNMRALQASQAQPARIDHRLEIGE
jgi:ABC-type phosphate transport system auxiliary subunit